MATGAPIPPSTSKPKTSGLAIASLILGIIGPCSLGLLSIVGLILGIMASKKIKASGGAVGGRGLAIAGIIVSILTLILGLALAAAIVGGMWFVGSEAMGKADEVRSMANLHQLCMAAMAYSVDQKDALPPADSWPEALKGRYVDIGGITTSPGKAGAGRAYAMNAKLGGMRLSQIRQPSETVLFFECAPGSPPGGGRADLAPEPPHSGGWLIAFCDGHVEMVPPYRLDRIVWDPKAE